VSTRPHLLVALSSHGFGHLSQAAPVVNQLRTEIPQLQVTVRAAFPAAQIARRIPAPDNIMPVADDFGMVMHDALSVDVDKSLEAYRAIHRNWDERVQSLARDLRDARVDAVLSDIPYLTLAAATAAGIPCAGMCSLNWAEILEHYIGPQRDPALIAEIRQAYAGANYFLQTQPCMPMHGLPNAMPIGPTAAPGRNRRDEIDERAGLPHGAWMVLVGMGGVPYALTLDDWPSQALGQPVHYLVPDGIASTHPNAVAVGKLGIGYSDLLASVDLIISKPGYGTFTEAAVAGVPVLYVARTDWPETQALTDWLDSVGHCAEIDAFALRLGRFAPEMDALLARGRSVAVIPSGNVEGARLIRELL
jgi:hypothetical protein